MSRKLVPLLMALALVSPAASAAMIDDDFYDAVPGSPYSKPSSASASFSGVRGGDEHPSQRPVVVKPLASQKQQSSGPLRGSVVNIPAGTEVKASLASGISSDTARVGDRGFLALQQDLQGIPAGSRIEYEVTGVEQASRGFDNPGEMVLETRRVIYPDGSESQLLNGYVATEPGATLIEGNSKGKRAAATAGKTATGAATGALGGLIGSAIGGGSLGQATAIGTGIGAGVGLVAAAFGKGREVAVPSGGEVYVNFPSSSSTSPQPCQECR